MSEHPFAQYVRILGKGKKGSRSLTQDEARAAFGMILREEVRPEQLGAFLMLLRVKEETGAEIAGFVQAVRDSLALPQPLPSVDLDWSSYAGKRRHLPWFLLAVLALADHGIKVFMHGSSGHTEGRVYTREVLRHFGLPVASNFTEAGAQLAQHNFSFMDLRDLCPKLQAIMDLRAVLGLRSPVHTLARQINPFAAPCSMQSIFHPGYQFIHQEAERILGQPHMAVIKGDGGEVECNPDSACTVYTVHDGVTDCEEWPAYFPARHLKPAELDLEDLRRLWRGEITDEYALGAIHMTLAVALKTMQRAATQEDALALAQDIWQARRRDSRYGW